MQRKNEVRTLSIRQWCDMVEAGNSIPVNIQLYGASMQPLVRRLKDTVTIVPLKRPLKKGDVVLFQRRDDTYVVHRVWKLRGNQVQTMGDNVRSADAWMSPDAVLGLVTHVKRGGCRFCIDTPIWRSLGRAWLAIHPLRKGVRRVLGGIKRRIRRR